MSGKLDEVFMAIPRSNFLPPDVVEAADLDMPLSIGYGQTNSQPYTVRLMLKWLDVKPGQKVLDVGSGSGWTTALLSHLVGPKGFVTAVEVVPELVNFGRDNCKKLVLKNVEFNQAEKIFGWPDNAPYDRILVSASAKELPQALLEQLTPTGRLVIPVKSSVFVITKNEESIETKEHPGFAFVPLISKESAKSS